MMQINSQRKEIRYKKISLEVWYMSVNWSIQNICDVMTVMNNFTIMSCEPWYHKLLLNALKYKPYINYCDHRLVQKYFISCNDGFWKYQMALTNSMWSSVNQNNHTVCNIFSKPLGDSYFYLNLQQENKYLASIFGNVIFYILTLTAQWTWTTVTAAVTIYPSAIKSTAFRTMYWNISLSFKMSSFIFIYFTALLQRKAMLYKCWNKITL